MTEAILSVVIPLGIVGAIYACSRIKLAHRSRMRRDIGFLTKPHVDHDPSEYATNWERDR